MHLCEHKEHCIKQGFYHIPVKNVAVLDIELYSSQLTMSHHYLCHVKMLLNSVTFSIFHSEIHLE